jgi:radical SAM superfamily enzyme YgiQ (UPF0313 family)
MKILLVSAPRPESDASPMHMGDGRPPMGLAYISAYLEQFGHETKIIDLYHFGGGHKDEKGDKQASTIISHIVQNEKEIDVFEEIESFKPDFVGMYMATISYYEGTKLATKIKNKYPEIKTMIGGPHANELPETLTDYFDYVVNGEGEIAALDIVEGRKSKKGIVKSASVQDINKLPLPDFRHFIGKPYNWKLQMFASDVHPVITLNSTRGCPFSCMFCGVANTKFRGISPRNLVNYIVELQSKYGAKGIYFREDNFTVVAKRVEEFCDIIIAENIKINWACETRVRNLKPHLIEKMAKAGCVALYIGIESGSDRMLTYMKKAELRKHFIEKLPIFHANGMLTYTTFVYGLPTETQEDRDETERFIEELNPTTADRFIYIGIPGSDYYKMLDYTNTYDFKEKNGLFYVPGWLELAKQIYGKDDPRCDYVGGLYEKNKINPSPMEPYYIDENVYKELATTKVRKQLSEKFS